MPAEILHRNVQQVVQQQSDGGPQSDIGSEIILRYVISSSAIRIFFSRLSIREVESRELHHDQDDDHREIAQAGNTDNGQYGEGRFGSIPGGSQRIEAEHRHTRPNREFFLFRIPTRPAAFRI